MAFGLAYTYAKPGQSMLDIGIGTGLGSLLFRKAELNIHGMDINPDMLEACRRKGFSSLTVHDLTQIPYPFETGSMDHAVCTGVLNFFSDLSPVFQEAHRIIRKDGMFVFVVGDRAENMPASMEIDPEHAHSDQSVTIYTYSFQQITRLLSESRFTLERDLRFTTFMDRQRKQPLPARCYLTQKINYN